MRESLGHQLLGRSKRSNARELSALENRGRRGANLTNCFLRTLWVITTGLLGDIDDPASVREKVRDIENVRRRKQARDLSTTQLIVRRSDNDLTLKLRHHFVGKQPS
jgi:hypothetical protein